MKQKTPKEKAEKILEIALFILLTIFTIVYLPVFITALLFRLMYRILIFPIKNRRNEIYLYGERIHNYLNL